MGEQTKTPEGKRSLEENPYVDKSLVPWLKAEKYSRMEKF